MSGGSLSRAGSLSRGSLSGRNPPDRDPSRLVNRMTDASKNITLPQTSFAGGKNYLPGFWLVACRIIKLHEVINWMDGR